MTRYLGISGTAQMKANLSGRIAQTIIRRFVNAAEDHQGAYDVLTATNLDYVVAGCP